MNKNPGIGGEGGLKDGTGKDGKTRVGGQTGTSRENTDWNDLRKLEPVVLTDRVNGESVTESKI